ncbi:MAG: SIS domain-containing protein [Legionellales bacterium]|nr:SIS domain-containing protein [Legionellales bacterium]
MNYIEKYLHEVSEITQKLDATKLEEMVNLLVKLREQKGKLFLLGVGGSAANCSHAVNDFRKITGIDAYTPTDNVAELTARTNDNGWDSVFKDYLEVSNFNSQDMLFILSVGGGNLDNNISPNLVKALQLAKKYQSKIVGIVGRDDGYTMQVADICILIPNLNEDRVTPHSEEFQSVICHLLVSHPLLAYKNK